MTDEATADPPAAPPVEWVQLPAPVRQRVVAIAAERLGELREAEIPASLRRVSRFTPTKRAQLAGVALAAAVESDAIFRNLVADGLRSAVPEVAAGLATGTPPAAADPFDLAAAAYLLRPPGWQQLVSAAVVAAERASESAMGRDVTDQLARLTRQLEQARATAGDDRAKHRAEATALAADIESARRALRQANEGRRQSEQAHRSAESEREAMRAAGEKAEAKSALDSRRLRSRVTELEGQLEQARRTARGARNSEDVRLWLLLDTMTNAAAGLRRELALPPAAGHPADHVAAGLGSGEHAAPAALGLTREDPAWLDALLAVQGTHLLVDGYNVTKTGYPGVSLEAQRGRLIQGLAALAARTAAEITVVFDGAERTGPLAAPSGRGVRVVFSPVGRTADDVLVLFVRAEPAGRPIAVVSADREVITRSEQEGARGVPPVALLGLLGRS